MSRDPRKNLKPFEKGKSGNPGGRKPLLPEVKKALDYNRQAIKALIIDELDNKVVEWVRAIIETGTSDGDALKFKTLLELGLGKMVDDQPDFPVSDEEKMLILEFRRRKREQVDRAIVGDSEDSRRDREEA